MKKSVLMLENGKIFSGIGFGSDNIAACEIVYNTSMVGYQEIISDPANYKKILVMNYPLIGNYGLTDEDYESKGIQIDGLVVREYNDFPSNFRFTKTLAEVMEESKVSGIHGIDTRELVGILNKTGSIKAVIAPVGTSKATLKKALVASNGLSDVLAGEVSSNKIWYSKTRNPMYNVMVIDLGVNLSMIRKLNSCGCNVIVAPYNTTKKDILKFQPDGILISNGAGSPNIKEVISLVKELKGKLPIAGIGLGAQVIALSQNATVNKMKNGHMGANIPVKCISNGKISITTQNHSYSIDADSLKGTGLEVTHINILDNEVEGILDKNNMLIGMQYIENVLKLQEDVVDLFTVLTNFMQNGGNENAEKNRY